MCDVSENFFTVIVPNLNYTKNEGKEVTCGVPPQVEDGEILKGILVFCRAPKSKKEILEHFGYKDRKNFNMRYLKPLLDDGRLQQTDRKHSHNQKYLTVAKIFATTQD